MQTTKQDLRKAFEDVRANHVRLGNCPGPHVFVAVEPAQAYNKKYRCEKCGGVLDVVGKNWYEQGLKHGAIHISGQGKARQYANN